MEDFMIYFGKCVRVFFNWFFYILMLILIIGTILGEGKPDKKFKSRYYKATDEESEGKKDGN